MGWVPLVMVISISNTEELYFSTNRTTMVATIVLTIVPRLAHSADVYNLHGAKRLVTITNVLSASCLSVNQDGENKPFLHIDCFT